MKAMLIATVAIAAAASPALAASKYRHHKPVPQARHVQSPVPYAWQRYGGAYAAVPSGYRNEPLYMRIQNEHLNDAE